VDPVDWAYAFNLKERVAGLRRTGGSVTASDPDLAAWRSGKWRAQSPFDDPDMLRERLAMDGVSEAEWLALLGELPEAVAARAPAVPPAWLQTLDEAYNDAAAADAGPMELPPALAREPGAGFLAVVAPLLRWGRERVRQRARHLASTTVGAPLGDAPEALLAAGLPDRMLRMISRTLVVELHVAKLEDRLTGETPAERFQRFVDGLSTPAAALALLAEYPVLGRHLATCVEQWAAAGCEFLERLCEDWPEILTRLAPAAPGAAAEDPGPLVAVDGGAGDLHRGGRAVMVAHFRAGFRLVYKPKPLAIDCHFEELLAWLNERGAPDLRAPRALARDGYGWTEFVAAAPCASRLEVERFYSRTGAWLALLYALEATDFHSENLIATGEHPILVDLESLFHPRFSRPERQRFELPAVRMMLESVLRVGLLPQRYWTAGDYAGLEVSGLGGKEGQLTAPEMPYWVDGRTDEMHLARGRGRFQGAQNRPRLGEAEVDVLDFTDSILDGFTAVYEILERHRDALLAADGPLALFAGDQIRVVLRHTSLYSLLLRESFHPDLLRNALDFDRILDRLWFKVDPEQIERVVQVMPSEHEDLWRGDIPAFSARVDGRELRDSRDRPLGGFLARSGLEEVAARLAKLGPADLLHQQWFIRGSLTSLAMVSEPAMAARPQRQPRGTADPARLVAAARTLGDRLEALALHDEESCSWVGLSLVNGRHWSLAPLYVDLYSGTPGIVLFLAHLARQTGEERYLVLAQSALRGFRRQTDRFRDKIESVGAFQGWGGILYLLTALGCLWRQPQLIEEAAALAATLPALIERDRHYDVVGGAAGCIAALLALHRHTPAASLLDIARACGERLLAAAVREATGVGWRTVISPQRSLTGFSHGAAGIAWALFELAAATGDCRFAECGREALAFERSLFDAEAGNWPDLRSEDGAAEAQPAQYMVAWCHGAPGIGLSRLRLLRLEADTLLAGEVEAALQATLRRGFGSNQSLCHGDLGNIELLHEATRRLPGGDAYRTEFDRRSAAILETIESEGARCGVPLGVETPGLLVGLAGIGLGLLRLADPDTVPCVLLLDPP
jgi:type 2 lantibiotic biosynthesis protein LanM